ncbi:MAG: alanine racemase [Balneolaceae bacterium]|nr:alanine racemase [Balneolaceae bacterium]
MAGTGEHSFRTGGHSVIEIDLGALRHNLAEVRRRAGEAGVMAVVKADAYGHGLVRIAGALEGEVQGLAVNEVAEGVALRRAGIRAPVLVFGVPESRHRGAYRRWDLTATVSTLHHVELLEKGSTCHLNVDTGMGRLGVRPEAAGDMIRRLQAVDGPRCTGIYSHFATADVPESGMARRQLARFREVQDGLGDLADGLTVHMSNSGGLFFYPEARFDLVRTGIALYGCAPGETPLEGLRPVLGWKTHLVQVNRVRKGETVSYGARWAAPSDGWVGVLPVGYEDGLRRDLSGKISVEIGSEHYELAGTVTMNYAMVWLGSERWPELTEVTLLGGENGVEEWAAAAGTISYEILTGLSRRVPRSAGLSSRSGKV